MATQESIRNLSENNPQKIRIRQMRALAGSIAHEMRNPLNACCGCAELISQSIGSTQEALDLMKQEIMRATQLIDIILCNINDGEIDPSEFEALSVKNCIDKALQEFAFGEDEREKVSISGDDFEFIGSETLMVYTLFNLLKNALYYLRVTDNGKITITVNPQNRTLVFADNGPGIPPDKIDNVFDSFETSGNPKGTGLGLPFCKQVMEGFGGDICVSSTKEEGCQFFLAF